MSVAYPELHLTEKGVVIGGFEVPEHWIDGGSAGISSEVGHFNRVTLTLFVEGIAIDPGVHFYAEEKK